MRVLVIEDGAKIAALLEQRSPHTVISASPDQPSPAAGQFDAVVIDSRVKSQAVLRICKDISAQDGVAPVIVLTDEDSAERRIEAFAAGADACLSGTLVVEELLARLRALVRRAEVSRGAAAG